MKPKAHVACFRRRNNKRQSFIVALTLGLAALSHSVAASTFKRISKPRTMTETPPTMTETSQSTTDLLDRTIYLCTFPPVPHVYSVSPFAIKLESYMRINKIPYTPVYGAPMSSKGMIPYIRLDDQESGEETADSNVVLSRIKKELGAKGSDADLQPEQRAMAHSVTRMLEEHTIQICFYYRYGLHMPEFLEALDIEHRFREGAADRWGRFQPDHTKHKTKMRGLTRHSDEELWEFSNDDLSALSDYLGDKPFFFGDKPTLADCTIFGHLSQFLWIPIDFPQKKHLEEHCPNLVDLLNRFRSEYWPDWEELCDTTVYPHSKTAVQEDDS
jgi:glutathione S-transferase